MNDKQKATMIEIVRLFGTMPYGGSIGFQCEGENTTLEMIKSNLEKLRDALQRNAEFETRNAKELHEYRSAMHGVAFLFREINERRVFGGETGEKLETYELELEGFKGGTDRTDNLIKWVRTPSRVALDYFISYYRLRVQNIDIHSGQPTMREEGVDVFLDARGHPVDNASIEAMKTWNDEIEEAAKNAKRL